jgi:hypothetical protein
MGTVQVNWFGRVRVANDPGPGRRCPRADRVAATIDFLTPDGEVILGGMTGRWAETVQRAETGRVGLSLDEAQLDIDPNGLAHPLDVAMKQPQDAHFYAYNFENSTEPALLLDKHRIGPHGDVHVRVTLRPANGDAVIGNFVLRSEGAGRELVWVDAT